MNNTNDANILDALFASLIKDKEAKVAKSGLPDGTVVTGEVTARVEFELTKGFESEANPSSGVLSLAVLSEAMVKSGVMVDVFKRNLLQAATEAMLANQQVGKVIKQKDPRVVAMEEELQRDVIAKLPKQKRSGAVKVKVLNAGGKVEILKSLITVKSKAAA